MKKAFDWLTENGLEYKFHDYKKEGVSKSKIEEWDREVSMSKIINKSGLTYKKLSEEEKHSLESKDVAIALLIEKTSMIKRPLLEFEGEIILGFNIEEWSKKLL
jgi:Spx/MgsR family transcriptional regulator